MWISEPRCCQSVMGQGYHRASAAVRAEAAFADRESLRKVVTVRGRTGAALIPTVAMPYIASRE